METVTVTVPITVVNHSNTNRVLFIVNYVESYQMCTNCKVSISEHVKYVDLQNDVNFTYSIIIQSIKTLTARQLDSR